MEKIPYSNAIGSVMYLMVSTRPDIAYAVSCLSRFMSNPGTSHWEALKWLFRYLNGSNNYGIKFSKCSEGVKLMGYVDSNYANDRDSRRSTTSYVFTLCGACISWKSQLQNIVALSTTEAEYIALTEAFKEALWLECLLKEIGFVTLGPRSSFGYDDHLRSATFGFGPRWRLLKCRPKSTYGPTHFNLLDGKTHQPRPTLNLPASHTRPGLISLTLITLTSLSPFSFTPHPFPMPRFVSLSLSRCLVLHRLLLVFSPQPSMASCYLIARSVSWLEYNEQSTSILLSFSPTFSEH
ncbi:Retrovirus-related Pol polyprotein from transposon TNT 1-94 [Sesamum angolense]|uniref:Retrovirus-related Pol polyprotein from transposon TNT 1-94 n=1 Tax=Sesamum angolense TaxID=2727404 RepID=A0AAE1WUZ4_9LAMI|nr:Retrovirus-related Pol polyprotein from transposon TNT 1-94 [Sesamum angolense]